MSFRGAPLVNKLSAPRSLSKAVINTMSVHQVKSIISIASLALILSSTSFTTRAQTQRGPSDVVREFYKALRDHRFKDAFAMTIYKPAVQDLTAEEMEDLRPGFEET